LRSLKVAENRAWSRLEVLEKALWFWLGIFVLSVVCLLSLLQFSLYLDRKTQMYTNLVHSSHFELRFPR